MDRTMLQPTPWRTCRVIANLIRLKLLAELARKRPQSVSMLAERVHVPLAVASVYLRALEARGLLTAKRIHRRVEYNLTTSPNQTGELLSVMAAAMRASDDAPAKIFRLATGFTHPARVELFRLLHQSPKHFEQLAEALGISIPALNRHLQKLISRGYVIRHEGQYKIVRHDDPIGRAMAALITE